jgi:hypothetical protein
LTIPAADGAAFRGIAVERFDDQYPAGLEGPLEHVRHLPSSHVTEENKVPAAFAEIKVFHPLDFRLERNAQLPCSLSRASDCLFGRIETGDVPTLLGKPNHIPALPHIDVQCDAGLSSLDCLHHELVEFGVEAGILLGQDAVPPFHFGARALHLDDSDLGVCFGIRETPGFEVSAIPPSLPAPQTNTIKPCYSRL